jgi:hypothetical protein
MPISRRRRRILHDGVGFSEKPRIVEPSEPAAQVPSMKMDL